MGIIFSYYSIFLQYEGSAVRGTQPPTIGHMLKKLQYETL